MPRLPACTAFLSTYDSASLSLALPVAFSLMPLFPPFTSQYALVYRGFSSQQDDVLYWQLPEQFTGDKVIVEVTGQSPHLSPGRPLQKYCTIYFLPFVLSFTCSLILFT